MIRLFLGVQVPGLIAEPLYVLARGLKGARPVSPENMHATLKFLGEIEEPVADEVVAALETLSARAFTVRLAGLGIFEGGRSGQVPHTLFAGIDPETDIRSLRERIERRISPDPVPADRRKYYPHVTIARTRGVAPVHLGALIQEFGDLKTEPFEVAEFILYSSHLSRDGADYRAEATFPLDGAFSADAVGVPR